MRAFNVAWFSNFALGFNLIKMVCSSSPFTGTSFPHSQNGSLYSNPRPWTWLIWVESLLLGIQVTWWVQAFGNWAWAPSLLGLGEKLTNNYPVNYHRVRPMGISLTLLRCCYLPLYTQLDKVRWHCCPWSFHMSGHYSLSLGAFPEDLILVLNDGHSVSFLMMTVKRFPFLRMHHTMRMQDLNRFTFCVCWWRLEGQPLLLLWAEPTWGHCPRAGLRRSLLGFGRLSQLPSVADGHLPHTGRGSFQGSCTSREGHWCWWFGIVHHSFPQHVLLQVKATLLSPCSWSSTPFWAYSRPTPSETLGRVWFVAVFYGYVLYWSLI